MVKKYIRSLYVAVSLLMVWGMVSAMLPVTVHAAQITSRSLTLENTATVGGSDPGGVVNHLFTFDLATASAIQSVQLLYCTTADGTCTTPTGLLTTSATIGTNTSSFFSGFTLTNTTNGAPYISSATAVTPTAATPYKIELDSVTNPTATNTTFYVRISTFSAATPTGTAIDTGNVAASTATPIQLSGQMPESLVFCVGATISTNTGGVPDCTTATPGTVAFTTLFSPTYTSTATSQMAASTNAGSGFVITASGATLTSGTNTITAITGTSPVSPVLGTSQFGINLVQNTTATATPAPGAPITPASDGVNYKGEPTTNYSSVDKYLFNTGDTVANSAYGGAGGTDAQIYTTTYIVDVPGNQPAGTYTTTITYICTPTF